MQQQAELLRFSPSHLRVESVARVLAAALVIGLLTVVNAIAFAGLIYHDALSAGMPLGIAAILLGTAVCSLVMAWGSSYRGMVASPIATTAVAYPLIASLVHSALPATMPDDTRAMAAAIACGLVTTLSGLAFLLTGMLRLGSLIRLLPYPVISGYNAGSGWLFIVGAIGLATSGLPAEARQDLSATALAQIFACVGLGALIVFTTRWARPLWSGSWIIIPGLLIIGGIVFHSAILAIGFSPQDAQRAGWLLGPFGDGSILTADHLTGISTIPWTEFRHAIGPALTIVLLGGTSAIMLLTGVELELHRRLDLDREMTINGMANILGGLAGGLATSHSVTGTTLTHQMGAQSRWVGTLVSLYCLATLALGAASLGAVPRFAVGALLFATGAERLLDRIVIDQRKLPTHEWLLVLLVLFSVIVFGYVQGVAIGLGLTLIIFALNYRRISVIRGIASGISHRSSVVRSATAQAVLARDGDAIQVCRLQGYLFFLNAAEILQTALRMTQRPNPPQVLILDFQHVVGMDTSACMVFRMLNQLAVETGCQLFLTAMPRRVVKQFSRQRIMTRLPDSLSEIATTDHALQHAEDLLLARAGVATDRAHASLAGLLAGTLHQAVAPERLAPYVEHVHFTAGAVLMYQGAVADALYFIEYGRVCAQLDRTDGPPTRLRSSTAGTIVGEVGIYAGGRRTATVVAEEDCDAVRLSVGAMARMETEDPQLAALLQRFLTALIAEKLSDTNRMLERALD